MSFQWIDCSFFLKRNLKNAEVTINLTPMHKLQYLNEEHQLKDINFQAKITFEKPLMYDQNMGWNWHKSWNIPDITVELLVDNYQAQQVAKNIKRLYAQIYIVKPVISKQYSLCIEDLGLEGSTCFSLTNNRTTFSGLKFSATSYNSEGSKFHFLVIIYEKNELPDEPWKILLSKISTPVFVDSRKSAREAELIKFKKLSAFVEPFETSLIEKRFVKKESKKQRDYVEELIENNLQGLYNYFGAANIRNKIKHPLFLAFKFDGCFEIYINHKLFQGKEFETEVHWVQHSLEDMYKWFQVYKPPGKIQTKKLVLLVKNREEKETTKNTFSKKIVDFLETLNNETIQVCTDDGFIPPCFKKLPINQTTLETYNIHKDSLTKNHEILYRAKEMELKNHVHESGESHEHSGKIEQKIMKEEVQDEDDEQKNSIKQNEQPEGVQKDGNQSSQQSSSIEQFGDQRLNIPLKCQILIDPVKKKPLKMKDIIKLHQSHKQIGTIRCEKNTSTNDKQLQVLNQLMKNQILEMKRLLNMKETMTFQNNRNMGMYGNFGMMMPPNLSQQNPVIPGGERPNIKTQPPQQYYTGNSFIDPLIFNFRPPFP